MFPTCKFSLYWLIRRQEKEQWITSHTQKHFGCTESNFLKSNWKNKEVVYKLQYILVYNKGLMSNESRESHIPFLRTRLYRSTELFVAWQAKRP